RSVTEAGSPHSEQRILPQAISVEKIMSSKVSPSPSAYQGPSSAMRSSTSPAGVSGSAANEQQQRGQYSSTCMALLQIGPIRRRVLKSEQLQVGYQWLPLSRLFSPRHADLPVATALPWEAIPHAPAGRATLSRPSPAPFARTGRA